MRYVPLRSAAERNEADEHAALRVLLDFVRGGKALIDAAAFDDYERYLDEKRREVLAAVKTLDRYLTGRGGNRRDDAVRYDDEFGTLSSLHLSDGGYSRLTVQPMEGWVGFDRGLASEKARLRWDELSGQSTLS